jgi:NAD(P)-dependent dehydrogenase (short-subunit alcohol dehydrogenase family)
LVSLVGFEAIYPDGVAPPFGKDTTTDDVVAGLDLSKRHFVITGASSGLGEESARALASRGATVTMLARNPARLDAAVARVNAGVPDAELRTGILDVADLSAVRTFASDFLAKDQPIDVLINNAGIMGGPLRRTVDGFEMQFGTNHLGPFLLTGLLAPAIIAGTQPRVVTVSSSGHTMGDVDFSDPNYLREETYNPWESYGRSKTANALFARELARRLGGQGVLSFSVHPGGVSTNILQELSLDVRKDMMRLLMKRVRNGPNPDERVDLKSLEQGTATQVWAATAPELVNHNGAYLADCGVATLGANILRNGMEPWILDDERAARLWTLSEELVSETFFD